MSKSSSRRLRAHALAVATAAALLSLSATAADAVNVAGLDSAPTHDRFIVKYRDGSAPQSSAAGLNEALNRAAAASPGGKALGLNRVRRIATGADVVASSRKLDRVEAAALMRQIAADPNVEYVEVDAIMRPLLTPNDPRYVDQWQYFDATGGIKANEAWDVSTGSGTVVAVLDTGSTSHSDLNNNVVAGYDFISSSTTARDGNGRDSNPQDEGDWSAADECYAGSPASNSSWHGTHVAGTVNALTNNGVGVAGTAFGAKVQHLRVLGKCGGSLSDIADAIVWASGGSVSGVPANATPAEVINMSLGGSGTCGSTYQAAIDGAVNRGTTVVVAAGNSNTDVSNSRPANCNNVIAVASTTKSGTRSSFSNYGSGIDLAAPGSAILSTLNSGTTTPGSEGYASYNGTSMATPHVAGVVALVQAYATTPKTPAQMEQLLKDTARAFPSTPDQPIGAGILNAKAAVDAANGSGGGSTLSNGVTVTGLAASTGNSVNYTMEVPSGSSNLKFVITGGTGDADLYVKYGSAPTDSSYDCRPYKSGNEETCSFTTPSAGTWYVRVKAYSSFSGVSLTGSYSSTQTYTNSNNYTINDNSTVESPISVSGRSGSAPSDSKVSVDIKHTFRGDLVIDLVAPDGSLYRLKNSSSSDSADNVLATYTVNLSSEALNGTWKLRVADVYTGDTGYIDSWSLNF
ncbi:MAG: S8 family serine peptidase [Steroidobacteraceae bacterium]|nr:S8 family serine peptidase [Steroidobacteraceae bacterium]